MVPSVMVQGKRAPRMSLFLHPISSRGIHRSIQTHSDWWFGIDLSFVMIKGVTEKIVRLDRLNASMIKQKKN